MVEPLVISFSEWLFACPLVPLVAAVTSLNDLYAPVFSAEIAPSMVLAPVPPILLMVIPPSAFNLALPPSTPATVLPILSKEACVE